ncbi:hypothetical protein GQ457_06G025690 [Hibiscus cannabinus]
MQLGLGFNSLKSSSNRFCNSAAAMKKFLIKSRDGRCSMFSQPSGNPNSVAGNWRWRRRMRRPDATARSMTVVNRGVLRGVVTIETVTP